LPEQADGYETTRWFGGSLHPTFQALQTDDWTLDDGKALLAGERGIRALIQSICPDRLDDLQVFQVTEW
jgi:hypothetical protein